MKDSPSKSKFLRLSTNTSESNKSTEQSVSVATDAVNQLSVNEEGQSTSTSDGPSQIENSIIKTESGSEDGNLVIKRDNNVEIRRKIQESVDTDNSLTSTSSEISQNSLSAKDSAKISAEGNSTKNPKVQPSLKSNFNTSGNDFTFDFSDSDNAKESCSAAGSSDTDKIDNVPVNYFVLKPTGEDFKFEFESW